MAAATADVEHDVVVTDVSCIEQGRRVSCERAVIGVGVIHPVPAVCTIPCIR